MIVNMNMLIPSEIWMCDFWSMKVALRFRRILGFKPEVIAMMFQN